MRGRKPALKSIAGGLANAPEIPSWLSAEAAAEWRRVVPELVKRRVLSPADMGAVEMYCVAAGRVRELQAELDGKPLYIGRETPRPHPAIRAQQQAIDQARRLAAELGLTPVSRGRPALGGNDEGSDDEWAGMGL